MDRKEQVLAKVRTIPALPVATMEVIRLLRDEEVDITALVETIEYDPGLTANVLRLANSGYFAARNSIASLRAAQIVRLGMKSVFQLVIMAAISPHARRPVKGYGLSTGQLLEHLVASAIAAEQLAKALQLEAPGHVFTGGLLHDVGKVVLESFVEVDKEAIWTVALQKQIPGHLAEQSSIGIDHAEAGAALLKHWGLPRELVELVRCHHEPERATGDTVAVDLVHMANVLAARIGIAASLVYSPMSETASARLRPKTAHAEAVVDAMLENQEHIHRLAWVD